MAALFLRVVFDDDGLSVPCEEGDRLLDLCDAASASIPFSCRDASCATCLVDVVQGAEHLAAPALHEQRLLSRLAASHTQRLACQVRLGAGNGVVHVRRAREADPSRST